MPTPVPQPAYIDSLNAIVADGVATMSQMARAAGVSRQHISNCLNECREKDMSLEVFQQISSWLVDEKGEVRQLEAFLGTQGGAYLRPEQVELDECIEEEAHDLLKETTYAEDALSEGETAAARRHAAKIRGLAELIIEEVEAVKEMHQSPGRAAINLDR